MFFILQKEQAYIDNLEVFVMKEILDRQKFVHQHTFMKAEDLLNTVKTSSKINMKEAVPVGSIEFVQQYLKTYHNVDKMNPIEVPDILRHERFLKRKYSIIEKSELPKEGYYFTKYVSELKQFSYTGLIENLKRDVPVLKDGLYQLSEVVEILSEYRCFVSQDDIMGIQFYNGDPTILPNEKEIELLKEMVIRYTVDKKRPMAYTFDIAIIKDRGLAIIECHPHTSVGLYGLYGGFLPYCYKFGLDWYIKHNNKLNKFNNF